MSQGITNSLVRFLAEALFNTLVIGTANMLLSIVGATIMAGFTGQDVDDYGVTVLTIVWTSYAFAFAAEIVLGGGIKIFRKRRENSF